MLVPAPSSTRSSSPTTSESTPDEQGQSETLDFSAWCHTFSPDAEGTSGSTAETRDVPVFDDKSMLMLDAFVEKRVLNPSALESAIPVNLTMFQMPQSQQQAEPIPTSSVFSNFSSDNSSSESAAYNDMIPRTTTTTIMGTRVVPPPPVQPRKMENSIPHRVVLPSKESCYNLAILTPNLPLSGTKSRVETQIRVALDLALTSESSGDPLSYDRVGSWKWLKLPRGAATRRRSRKEGKIDASSADTLYLDVEVTCTSSPFKLVYICSTCQGREAKRVARKIAARVKPARSDCESNDGEEESSSKIIQFNCPDTLDFSSGSVVLPLRVTCYCRHHREKVGFNVHFVMKDDNGRVVGKGTSPPIMITDDHKSSEKNMSRQLHSLSGYLGESDWDSRSPFTPALYESSPDFTGHSGQSKQRVKPRESTSRRRSKPYDAHMLPGRTKRAEVNKQDIRIDSLSPIFGCTLGPYGLMSDSVFSTAPPSPHPSTPNTDLSPLSPVLGPTGNCEIARNEVHIPCDAFVPLSPPDTAPSSPPKNESMPELYHTSNAAAFALSIAKQPSEPVMTIQSASRIHRLIPASGPTFGGIEVTVLGSNFYPDVSYNCVFGGVVSSSTTRWSENTLVCVLPPRAYPGPVSVTLEGMELDPTVGTPAIFTYTNETTDRALMELALQIVGLRTTGKVEEAKDIAVRIVRSSAQEPRDSIMEVNQANQVMNLASNALPDSRRLLLRRADDAEFEKIIIECLLTLDSRDRSTTTSELAQSISHPTKTGQTLLHLAALLKLSSLVEFLICQKIEINAQDLNGYTALHFAVLGGSLECIRHIIAAGADASICTKMGYTAYELVDEKSIGSVLSTEEASNYESDEESNFGDIEEIAEAESYSHSRLRRRVRLPRSRRSSRPASATCSDSDVDQFDSCAAAEDDDNATVVSPDPLPLKVGRDKDTILDEKQAASFAGYLHRAWEQFNPPHFMPQILNMPQLPVPAWVFPVFVPIQTWPTLRSGKQKKVQDGKDKGKAGERGAYWEKWTTQMSAAMAQQSRMVEIGKPYELDSRCAGVSDDPLRVPAAPSPVSSRSIFRRFGYNQQTISITDKEVRAYSYRHKSKALAKTVKQEDRMLILFWIPILILAIGWALYSSYPIVSSLGRYMHLISTLH